MGAQNLVHCAYNADDRINTFALRYNLRGVSRGIRFVTGTGQHGLGRRAGTFNDDKFVRAVSV